MEQAPFILSTHESQNQQQSYLSNQFLSYMKQAPGVWGADRSFLKRPNPYTGLSAPSHNPDSVRKNYIPVEYPQYQGSLLLMLMFSGLIHFSRLQTCFYKTLSTQYVLSFLAPPILCSVFADQIRQFSYTNLRNPPVLFWK